MGKKGSKHHQKRLAAPLSFPMERKGLKFTFHGIAGSRKINEGIPLGLIIRDMLNLASNLKELKYILNNNLVFIDGKPRKDPRYIVGPMDVIEIPSIKQYYRFVPWVGRRKIKLISITKEDSTWKLVSIKSKTNLRGGKLQLNLDDGRNIIINQSEEDKNTKFNPSIFTTRGTLKIEFISNKILDYYPFDLNSFVLIRKGINTGLTGKLQYLEKRIGKNRSVAIVQSGEDDRIITAMENIFIIGKETTDIPYFIKPEHHNKDITEEQ